MINCEQRNLICAGGTSESVRRRDARYFIGLALFLVAASSIGNAADVPSPTPSPEVDSLIEVPAAPEEGFNFEYVLFIPKSAAAKPYPYLLVEPNNTGRPDDIGVHRSAAVALARGSSVGNFVAQFELESLPRLMVLKEHRIVRFGTRHAPRYRPKPLISSQMPTRPVHFPAHARVYRPRHITR